MSEEEKPDLQRMVELDKKQRFISCSTELQTLLQKYNCTLETITTHVNGVFHEQGTRVKPL